MGDGFLGRWSKRKEAVRKGEEVRAEPVPMAVPAPLPSPQPSPASGRGSEDGGPPPLPTLAEAQALTPESDFTRFVRPGVAPEVQNAAFKKLFADPHFNVMDRLDTYIDDYSKPDPIPPEMLRQLASAKFLKLFDEEEEKPQPRESAEGPQAAGMAQSGVCTDLLGPTPGSSSTDDADPDLRLQQDHAAPGKNPGDGAA